MGQANAVGPTSMEGSFPSLILAYYSNDTTIQQTPCIPVSDNVKVLYSKLFLPTALAREVMRSPPSVRLFPLCLRNRLTVDLELLHVTRS